MERYENALFCYEKALDISPDISHIWSLKGSLLNKLNKNSDAIEAFDVALSIKIEPDTLYNKGMTYFKINKPDDALECFEIILEIDPNNSKAISARKIAKKLLNKL